MAYVNYKNSPSEETPLTGGATGNLNVMQENGTSHGTDTKLGYAQSFLNKHIINVSNEVDEDYRVNLIKGNNLFDKDNFNNLSGLYVNDDVATISTSSINMQTLYINIIGGKTYTINKIAGVNFRCATTQIQPALGVSIDNKVNNDTGTTITVNTNLTAKYLCVSYYGNTDTQSQQTILNSIVIVEGDEEPSTYIPFTYNEVIVNGEKYTDTVNVGTSVDIRNRVNVLYSRNLFDALIQAGTYSNATYSVASDGKITQSASDSSTWSSSDKRNFKLKKGTYTASIIGKPNNVNFQMRNITASSNIFEGTNNSYTFTLTDDSYVAFKCWSGSATYPIDYYIMLVEGSSALDYEPYITPSINVDGDTIYERPVLLWQNPSPTSAFAGQLITLRDNLKKYSYYEIIYSRASGDFYLSTGKLTTNYNGMIQVFRQYSYFRSITVGQNITMGDCAYYTSYGSSNSSQDNSYLIPYQVIGYK